MTESKRTLAEYRAAAMLLDRWYDAADHTFTKFGGPWSSDYMIDADTLEPVSQDSRDYLAR